MSSSCKKIAAGFFAVFQLCATQSICQTQSEIDKLIFKSVLKRQFTRILGGSSALPGNYVGLDIKDAKLTGSGTANLGDYSLITFNVNAGVTEGIAPIFTNSKVNPSVGLETKFSFLNPFTDKSIITDDDEQLAIEERINQIFKFYEIEVNDIQNKAAYMDNIIALCQDSLSNMVASISKLNSDLSGTTLTAKQRKKSKEDLLKLYESQLKVTHLKDSVDILNNNLPDALALNNERNSKVKVAPDKLIAKGVAFSWFSIGYKLENRNFYLFDATKAVEEQLTETDFTMHNITVEYNHLSWNDWGGGSWFLGGGLSFLLDDNKHELEKTEVTETNTYAAAPNARTEQKKYTAFTGEYKKDLRSVRPFLDFYFFPGAANVGIHLYPETHFIKDKKPLTNFGTGIFLTFTDKNDKGGKAKVNFELYIKFNDLDNNLEKKNYAFHERNEIGIRTVFPLTLNP